MKLALINSIETRIDNLLTISNNNQQNVYLAVYVHNMFLMRNATIRQKW